MNKLKYADEGMDMKKWVIMLLDKSRWILLFGIVCALVFGIVYTISHTVPRDKREYRAVSKLYLDFAVDETGEVYQAYNGYTWNDLMATDPILNVTMEGLPAGISRQEVVDATQATILSDLRLLTITITTHDPAKTGQILDATNTSLEKLGATAKEFVQIETIEETQPELVIADNRLLQAVVLGLVFGIVASLLTYAFLYVADDRIYTVSDLRKVTAVAFLGYDNGAQKDVLLGLQRDYEENAKHCKEQCEKAVVCRIEDVKNGLDFTKCKENATLILEIPYAKVHGAYLAYCLEQLKMYSCDVQGVYITDYSVSFMKKYYGNVVGKKA